MSTIATRKQIEVVFGPSRKTPTLKLYQGSGLWLTSSSDEYAEMDQDKAEKYVKSNMQGKTGTFRVEYWDGYDGYPVDFVVEKTEAY